MADEWLALARRIEASRKEYERLAEKCWRDLDIVLAVKFRGLAEGLALAQEHQLTISRQELTDD